MVACCAVMASCVSSPPAPPAPPAARPAAGTTLDKLTDAMKPCEICSFPRVRSVLAAQGGKLVYEKYWSEADAETLHDTRSAMKSITALLVGIAVGEGRIPAVTVPAL